jgi:N-acetylglucosaminyldiphosphoundecaprenol N-acetyl-beta-D-mannosaminyltransferase
MKKILGIRIDAIKQKEFNRKINEFISSNNFHHLATVNPEFLVDAQNNEEFFNILTKTDLNLIDGFGLQLAYFFKYKYLPDRLPGVDMVDLIFSVCADNGYSIFLLGGINESALIAKKEIIKKYPKIKIFALEGGNIEKVDGIWQEETENIVKINSVQPDVLLVGLGHPKQELWISDHKTKLPSVKIAIGVGGTFDYLSKQIKRAPLLYQRFGLEWLYRLYQQPWRWRRIFKAVFTFAYLFFTKYEKPNN